MPLLDYRKVAVLRCRRRGSETCLDGLPKKVRLRRLYLFPYITASYQHQAAYINLWHVLKWFAKAGFTPLAPVLNIRDDIHRELAFPTFSQAVNE